MSDEDDEFGDGGVDVAVLAELDRWEAGAGGGVRWPATHEAPCVVSDAVPPAARGAVPSATATVRATTPPAHPTPPASPTPTIPSSLLQAFDMVDAAQQLHPEDAATSQRHAADTATPHRAVPRPPSTPRSRPDATPSSSGLVQQGLFGRAVQPGVSGEPRPSSPVQASQGHLSLAPGGRGAQPRVKTWDHAAFRRGRNRRRGRPESDEDAPHSDAGSDAGAAAARGMRPALDREQARTWIYPTNKPLRAYQLNIVRKALFHNVLVALPTGLGKTFIAAVVILNMFRWFPRGKIIFVAPTRPLVAQQQQACHSICGLPWDVAIELTGSTRRTIRDDEWQTKRIFYMTPQTFENDLLATTSDPRDVVCVVVDEAHRATGNYSYCNVVRHLMYHNPHFRLLALTATPGGTAERVQEVVDNLHISRIEIRTEDALDLQPYLHRKREDLVAVRLTPPLAALRAAWAELMAVYFEPLVKHGVLRAGDPAQLRAFAVRAAATDAHGRAVLARHPFLRQNITQLAAMAQAMQYLQEQSVRVFCDRVRALAQPPAGKRPRRDTTFSAANPRFRRVIEMVDALSEHGVVAEHPKMTVLRNTITAHFAAAQDTRVMVFCTFREVVAEIVAMLKAAGLRAAPFIGQSTDSKGNRGYTQRVQEQVVRDFQDGTFELLVATSIGEEGLDIGEVDLIVCYDAVRDSVRTLQRIGRTGRRRDGRIAVLMSEGREEANWRHSKDSYKHVQRLVRAADSIELYTDVPRLVPADVQPESLMCEVDQPAFEPGCLRRGVRKEKTAGARKAKPARAAVRGSPAKQASMASFCRASEVHRGIHAPTSSTAESRSAAHWSDDSDDAELASGVSMSRSSGGRGAEGVSEPTGGGASEELSQPALRYAPHPLIARLEEREDDRRVNTASHLFQFTAERDTASEDHGESDESDDGPSTSEENDEDRAHVGDFAPTQHAGYNQQAVYLQSMLSQGAPSLFRRTDRLAALLERRRQAPLSSEADNRSLDEYSHDSFVVSDGEVSWEETQSSGLGAGGGTE
ncbi:DNA helicase [Malassezia sp. CBS 17886]|nr:DNA helicase [Malassezia sp. CBS 17886]